VGSFTAPQTCRAMELVHFAGPMTGKEEQFLATDRFARGNTATNMILKACIKEDIEVNKLLLEDRNLFVDLPCVGISYGQPSMM